jgi:hypothetical protein
MKLNFMTDQGSILDTTSCASRASAASGLGLPLGATRAAGRRAVPDLFLTVIGALPLPIAPPGFPTALGLSFFFFRPTAANGAATLDLKSSDGTDPGEV